jgi:hypothetical protein
MDHRLEFLDQTALELMRVTGRRQLMQCIWVYEGPIDIEGLQRFHRNMAQSLGHRLIELSPLPFGRPRWVRPVGPPPPMLVAEQPVPREDLLAWADGLAAVPIDPVHGPAWQMVVQPFTDGSTAVCMLGSHVTGDGVGSLLVFYEAIVGTIRDPGYALAGSRTRAKAVRSDLCQAVCDLPQTARALGKAARLVRDSRAGILASLTARRTTSPDDDAVVQVPSTAVVVDSEQWSERARLLGGNAFTLMAGFTARFGERMARVRPSDGLVTLLMAVNLRESLDDDRALAMAFGKAVIDPASVIVDQTDARAEIRRARAAALSEPDPALGLMPLVPWLPRGAVRVLADLLFAYSEDLPVSCSNLGELVPQLADLDGTPATYLLTRSLDANVRLGDLRRSHGHLVAVSSQINGQVSICLEGYELGAENSRNRLRDVAEQTLADFGLTGRVD